MEYLEEIDVPPAQKKAAALAVVKLLHKLTGGKWDKEIERAVEGAIEYVLAEVREDARKFGDRSGMDPGPADPVEEPPDDVPTSNYGLFTPGFLPDDGALIQMGFKPGDQKWTTKNLYEWTVLRPGAVLDAGAYNFEGLIGEWVG